MITDEEMHQAIDRIARSEDGHLLYLYFQKALCATTTTESALPRNEGRRSFAAELMAIMAKGIRESGRADSIPITFAVAGPRSIAGTGSGPGRIRAALARADTESGAG